MQKNILLKVAARVLLKGLEEVPGAGAIIKMGREGWQALREAQEEAREEERVAQLEQAASITPQEARKIAQEVIAEVQREGHNIDTARAESVQDIISVMPAQIHERTRATLNHARRLGTQAVVVLPVTNKFKSADREAFYTSLFPQRRPQFHNDDVLPHGSRGWQLERLIGAGGFGEVWLARKAALAWAVKFCQDETSAALLKRESKTLNEIQQKLPAGTAHIAALLDFQLDEMPYWLAFEYVEGGTLESRIRLGPMDWPTAWSLFEPILQGMAMVHELNIVHRDLKPANILLDKNLKPRIADFGIGKIMATQVVTTQQAQRSQSMTTRGYGSLGYMSPEQASGNDPAHSTDDVYALGVILWQMLRGTVQQFPEFPDDIADLAVAYTVKHALSRCRFSRRDKRPQTARELLQLLSASLPELVEGNVSGLRQAQPTQSQIQTLPPSNVTAPATGVVLKIIEEGTLEQLIALAKQTDLSESIQQKMLDKGLEKELAELTNKGEDFEKNADKLVSAADKFILIALAINPCLSDAIQDKLSNTGLPVLRIALATNLRLTKKLQNYLATTGNQYTKCGLAKNSAIDLSIQSILLKDEDWSVRRALAHNLSLDISFQTQLLKDKDRDVRAALASNPCLTHEMQKQLAMDGEERVVDGLASNTALMEELMEYFIKERKGLENLAKNPALPERLQALLIANSGTIYKKVGYYSSYSISAREILATNPALTIAQQHELAKRGDVGVRLALLTNNSVVDPLRTSLKKSFIQSDLTSLGDDLDRANREEKEHFSEWGEATKKCFAYMAKYPMGELSSWFYSQDKADSLDRESNDASDKHEAKSQERVFIEQKYKQLKAILESLSN